MTVRSYRGYGGGGRGYGGGSLTLSFPPFAGAIKWLVIINVAVFLLMLLLSGVAPRVAAALAGMPALTPTGVALPLFSLVPFAVLHGWIWQLVSYSFFHAGIWHILWNMLGLWFFGYMVEQAWGAKQFYEFYFYCAITAALTTVGVSYLGLAETFRFLGTSPLTTTIGASGAIYGVMVACAVMFGDMEFMLFPFPFHIKVKYLVAIYILIAVAQALSGGRGQSVAYTAHLGGAFFGWLYVKYVPRRGLGFAFSERYFGVRNSYYRWKRRRAAKKFEVYMRKHDRSEYFDEYGNYRDPKKGEKGNGGSSNSSWVN